MTNRKRKGISPIIATVLLIAITIAAGLAIYGWVSGLIGAGTGSRLTGSTPLSLTVVSANVVNSATNSAAVIISISNQGSHDVTLTNANIQIVSSAGVVVPANNITGIGSPSSTLPTTSSFPIPAGTVTTVEIAAVLKPGTYILSIVGATDNAGNTVIANSVTFTIK